MLSDVVYATTVAFVSGGPDNVQLYPSTSIYILNIGETLGPVVCSADCTPFCSFKWKKDDITVVNNANFIFLVQNKNNAGNYTCVATRGASVTDMIGISLFVRCTYVSVLHNISTVNLLVYSV